MSVVTFNPSLIGAAQLTGQPNYYTCRNAENGDYAYNNTCMVGQWYWGSPSYIYYCYRGFIFFDTSGLPNNAIITEATLNMDSLASDDSEDNFNIILRGASSVGDAVVVGDYHLTHYNGENLGELTTNPPSTSDNYCHFALNIAGRNYINIGGLTKFVLLSEEDIDNSPPTHREFVTYQTVLSKIILTITYFEPITVPTVTTIDLACKDRQSTTLTATGDITSSGDGYTYRGFEYYEKGANLEYLDSMYAVREIGTFHILGQFEMTLMGLKPSTIYYIRAFAGNVFGIAYGEWVLCSTIAGSSSTYDVYTEPNTATYKLYVSDDEAIAWRGYKGPYTAKQQNINITDITNKTKGVKVLKLLPSAKGTFHICVTVKQELKS
jgi:hypothetical protein